MSNPTHPLAPIFYARSVAVLGASRDPSKRGHQIVRALVEADYRGAIYPVNPQVASLLGLQTFPSVAHIPSPPDVAIVCTPLATVPAMLEDCGRKGVKGAIVLAVGATSGGTDPLEQHIRTVSRATGLRVLGPNTSGMCNFPLGLNLVGVRGVRPGRVAILGQSGNMALALMQEAMTDSGAGISIYIGVGNEVDLGFDECLEFLGGDPGTDVILVYAEGLRNGRRFVEVARGVTPRKPVVLLKGGRTAAGSSAVSSHTGAVAGAYEVFRAAMKEAGVIEVERSDELFAVGTAAARRVPLPAGGMAIVADGGGHATLASDALSACGVPVAKFSADSQAALRRQTNDAATVTNPIDLAGAPDQDPRVFDRVIETVMNDSGVSGVLVSGLFGGYAIRFDPGLAQAEEAAARAMSETAASSGKPLVVHTLYAATPSAPLDALRMGGVTVVRSLEVACRCVAALQERRGAPIEAPPAARKPGPARHPGGDAGLRYLPEPEARALLAAHDVPLVPAALCRTADEVRERARELGGRVVLKAVSPHLPHKTDAGGVRLGLASPDAAAAAFEEMFDQVTEYLVGCGLPANLEGVLVAPMLPAPVVELLVGVRRDPGFGPVLVLGAGGVGVEVYADVAIRLLPTTDEAIVAALTELRIAPLVRGHRGRPGIDQSAIARMALGIAACFEADPGMQDLEVNPVFAYADGVVAVDVRAFVRREP